MSAAQYYNATPDVHLKPMHLASSAISVSSTYTDHLSYNAVPHAPLDADPLGALSATDLKLKKYVRALKLLSRVVGTVLSAATLVPLILTIVKFVQTRDVYFEVDGKMRTAWAHDSITWYTYMYAGVAAVSFLLNLVVLASYGRSVQHANRASNVSSYWTWLILLIHVVVWCVSAGLYRYGKEPTDGKFRDLWGWTCSTGAKELQAVLTSVDFDKYCGIQSASWYIGLTNIGTGLLSILILVLAVLRRKSKKRIDRVASTYNPNREPLRQS